VLPRTLQATTDKCQLLGETPQLSPSMAFCSLTRVEVVSSNALPLIWAPNKAREVTGMGNQLTATWRNIKCALQTTDPMVRLRGLY